MVLLLRPNLKLYCRVFAGSFINCSLLIYYCKLIEPELSYSLRQRMSRMRMQIQAIPKTKRSFVRFPDVVDATA